MMKSLIKARPIPVILFLCLIAFADCSKKSSQPGSNPVIFVKTETVEESDQMDILSYSGVVEDNSSVALSFSVPGTVEKVFVSEGEFVPKGRLVARLDTLSAHSVFNAAGSSLKQAKDGYERLKSIHDKGSLPDVQMVDIETKLNQAQSTYDIARKNLENCSLYAPISGVVGKRMTEAGENALPGKTIITLMDISSVKVSFSVPENEISLIPSECESIITVSALDGKQFHGKRIEKNIIANQVSHTYPASATLPNPRRELLPGMVCRVDLNAGKDGSAVVIPIEVVMASADGRKFVWWDDNGTARRRFISTGKIKGNGVEVKEGLSAGERIVTEGFHKISEGDKISVR